MSDRRPDDTIRAVDLFCGAGGLSVGLAQACESFDRDVKLAAVNHWGPAIETHERNHPWADHYNAKVEELDPRDVFETERVDILTGGPQCTHFSNARGSRPVDEQKRASPWHVLDWLQKLYVDGFVLENVPELRSWGPVGADGQPLKSKKGETFDAWINAIHSLGYSVDWQVLNAADHGDATSRERLFIVGRRQHRPEFPDPTHSEHGDGETDSWRSARDIIDWSDAGDSIWQRSTPLVGNTMERIADGLRRHAGDDLEPFADAVGELTKADVTSMQADPVPADDVADAAEDRSEPFLASYQPTDGDEQADDLALCVPYLLRQQSGGRPPSVDEPVPTIATKAAIGKVEPYLIEYYGNGRAQPVDDPLPTVTTKDRFALCVPECYPFGIDIRYRLLQPRELAAAMGFPDDYDFAGTKTEVKEQIGNAVPVNLAQSLVERLLVGDDPTLAAYSDGASSEVEADD